MISMVFWGIIILPQIFTAPNFTRQLAKLKQKWPNPFQDSKMTKKNTIYLDLDIINSFACEDNGESIERFKRVKWIVHLLIVSFFLGKSMSIEAKSSYQESNNGCKTKIQILNKKIVLTQTPSQKGPCSSKFKRLR